MRAFSNAIYFFKRRILIGFSIPKNALVIDIGSGDKPFWRADVLLDNLTLGNSQRISGMSTVTSMGIFVNGDITNTKFKDKVFDFSYCTHLLEHVENPEAAIKEIMRISKAGYLEVPNGLIECIRPFISHLWFIFYFDNQLVFYRKSKNMHNILDKNGKNYWYMLESMHDPFIRLNWKGKINYKIIEETKDLESYVLKKYSRHPAKNSSNLYISTIKIMRKLFYKKKWLDLKKIMKTDLISS